MNEVHAMTMKGIMEIQINKYFNDYLIGTEEQLQEFCSNLSINYDSFGKRYSTNGNRILIEVPFLNARKRAYAKELGICTFVHYQVVQLGISDYSQIVNKEGQSEDIYEQYSWLYAFNIVSSPVYTSAEPEISEERFNLLNSELSFWTTDN